VRCEALLSRSAHLLNRYAIGATTATPCDIVIVHPVGSMCFVRTRTAGLALVALASACSYHPIELADHGPVVDVAAGTADTCIVHEDGTVGCRGSIYDVYGERPPAEALHGLVGNRYAQVGSMCGLNDADELRCWGFLNHHAGLDQVPAGPHASPSLCLSSAVALDSQARVEVWGSSPPADYPLPTEALVSVATDCVDVCGITTKGEISCAVATRTVAWDLIGPPMGAPFVAISASAHRFCGLDEVGRVLCQGGGVPEDLSEVVEVASISGGACVLRANGEIRCFSPGDRPIVAEVPEGVFTAMDVGETHACAVRDDGEVLCWGEGHDGGDRGLAGEFQYADEAY
jgi:hypothetical protein